MRKASEQYFKEAKAYWRGEGYDIGAIEAIARLMEENAKLREDNTRLNEKMSCQLGVGNGDGQLFVYGDYESIKECQRKLIEYGRLLVERETMNIGVNNGTMNITL